LRKDRSSLWPAGESLANRAAAAVKRQPNLLLTAAVLREWAQIELDRGDRAKAEARLGEILERAGAPEALTNGEPPRWFNASARSVWFAQDGYLVQAWNDQPSFLLFDTPLAGEFEFSVDASDGFAKGGGVGYAGVVFDPNVSGRAVWPVGRNESIYRNVVGIRPDQFNRLIVQVSPGKVRCLVNGQLFFCSAVGSRPRAWR
jgi:hypothetical protein